MFLSATGLHLAATALAAREAADARHALPGAELKNLQADAFEQRRAADGHVGHGDAAVAAERPRRVAMLRLGGVEPDGGAENLAERIVGDLIERLRLDGLRAGRSDIA